MDNVSVSQLNALIAFKLKSDEDLWDISVSGEISNFVNHRKSGHMYFTLKDNQSSLKCVMFKSNACFLRFIPENGQQVTVSGDIRVYERDGVYQLYAVNIERKGDGEMLAEFERLKEKLEKGGYFSQKRPIPVPKRICIITAKTGAALQDILTVLRRRYPFAEAVLISALVQGNDAPASLVSALEKAQESGADVIIFGRGGGSIEDLWAFNDEKVVMAVYNSKIPTISAVGHETDFTLCDFTADLRAPTPSAAAEMAVPDIEDIRRSLLDFEQSIRGFIIGYMRDKSEKLAVAANNIVLKSPAFKLKSERERLRLLSAQIKTRMKSLLSEKEQSLRSVSDIISALSPVSVLMRGYAIAFGQDGKVVKRSADVKKDDVLRIKLHSGEITAKVIGEDGI